MERQYKAFISYRHRPLDMQTAKRIHTRIEHYTIPKALRKDGQKKPGIVFRDQEELPISSDLSSNIREALDHSEFLIVICTPETDKSAWVREEISYFLSHHDHDHVLAILAEGTPETSFPRQLREVRAEDGRLLNTIEPLAANIVADSDLMRRRLFRTESLRILAALIGCAFDDLYRREQRYRLRRLALSMILITVLAAGFIGMLLNRNAEIRGNYERALRNQSQYLASESLKALKEGDQLRAISLAIEALPAEGRERPRVSEAEYALGCAVHAYLSPDNAIGLQAVGMLPHTSAVQDFHINDSCTLLCSYSRDGALAGWDLQSMKKLWTLSFDTKGIAGFLDDSRLVAWSEGELYCVRADDGERIWSVPVSALSADSWASISKVCVAADSQTVIASSNSSFAVLDGEIGAVLRLFPWPDRTGDGREFKPYNFGFQVSPDGGLLATQCSVDSDLDGITVFDLSDGSVRLLRVLEGEQYIADNYAFSDDGLFFFSTTDLAQENAYSLAGFERLIRSESILHCEDLSSGETLWESSHFSSSAAANEILRYDTTLKDSAILVYAYANHMDILDPASGAFLVQTEFSSRLVGVDIFAPWIFCVSENGERGYVRSDDLPAWHSSQQFVSGLLQGTIRPGSRAWVLQNGSDNIVCYAPVRSDPNWLEFETVWEDPDGDNYFYPDDMLITPGCVAFLDGQRLLLNDGDPTHPLRELLLPSNPESYLRRKYSFDSCCGSALDMIWLDSTGLGVLYADTATGEYRSVPWPDEEHALLGLCGLDEGRNWAGICCREETLDGSLHRAFSFQVLNEDLMPEKTLELGSFSGQTAWDAVYDGVRQLYLYLPDEEKCFRADILRGSVTECGEGILRVFAEACGDGEKLADTITFSPDGMHLALKRDPREYLIFGKDGRALYSIGSETQGILAVSFTPDGRYLLSVETDGMLRRYRTEDGALLSRSNLVYSGSLRDYTEIAFSYTESGFLALRIDHYMNLISTEDWGVFAYVPGCYAYLEDRDLFVCYSYSGSERIFTGIRRYTLDSLVSRGQSLLNGWELSDSQRMRYGLD